MRLFLHTAWCLLLVCILGATPLHAQVASLSLPVSQYSVQEGDQVTVTVTARALEQAINAVSGTILYPDAKVKVVNVSKNGSIIDLWTREPSVQRGRIPFEGIILNPGFQGATGTVFRITFEAMTPGTVDITFANGALLANDGLGSNIAVLLRQGSFTVTSGIASTTPTSPGETIKPQALLALPVITDFAAAVSPDGSAFIKGKGEPNALTKIVFKDNSFKSIGQQFIEFLQTKKRTLDEVIVKNNASGEFEYTSQSGVLAGAYNATPYLVDTKTDTEKPGLGVQFLVSDSPIVRVLVVIINVLALLIPVVGLVVVIYFIPWYSFRRMRVIGKRFGLEEDKLAVTRRAITQEPPEPITPPSPPAQG